MDTLRTTRIVLIDDEPGVLKALTLMLESLGHQVMPFNNPSEALTYLHAGIDADLVLSDQRMPGMSGTDLFGTLRASSINCPFVLMSGHAKEEEVKELLSARSTAFLPKPFTPALLIEAIQGALGFRSAAKAV